MKKTISVLLVGILMICMSILSYATNNEIKVSVDDKILSFDVQPQIVEGRTLVPFRGIFEALGSDVDWDGENKTAIGMRGNIIIKLPIGEKKAYKNDQPVEIDVPATIIEGRTFVPVRFIAESLGAMVTWDGGTKTVVIKEMGEKTYVKDQVAYVGESGGIYTGDFQNDRPNGKGSFRFYESNQYRALKYKGEFKNGRMVGEGVFEWLNGDKYIGKFNNNQKHGEGTLIYINRDCYTGNWKEDKKSDQGTMKYANGNQYEGQWLNDQPNGKGIKTWANGDHYEGKMKDGLRHGQGTMVYANGDRYEGSWEEDKFYGKGTMKYANKDQYEGAWKAGYKDGQGTFTAADGKVTKGTWKKDELIENDADWNF
ncbi:MAG: stalk domain-containing protein [Marinisporobacter sp.]|nr:stalk domain-containing protein [Marinisporobacter sp.]